MVRKIKAKLILQLRNPGLSRRAIESAQGVSRHSIQAVLDAAEQLGLGWDDLATLPEAEVYAVLFPGRSVRESVFAQPARTEPAHYADAQLHRAGRPKPQEGGRSPEPPTAKIAWPRACG